jgi:hypothetical protein
MNVIFLNILLNNFTVTLFTENPGDMSELPGPTSFPTLRSDILEPKQYGTDNGI